MNQSPTIQALEALCNAAASAYSENRDGYQPTATQIFFFVAVWCQKNQVPAQSVEEAIDRALCDGSAQTRVTTVANHLNLWGEAVSGLQQEMEREWLVLGKQMERGVKRYNVDSDLKEDALQTAQIKVWQNLAKIPAACELEEKADLIEFIVENQTRLKNIYDFGSPIYNWAKRVASNELGMAIRASSRSQDRYPLDEWIQDSEATAFMDSEVYQNGSVENGSVEAGAADPQQAMVLQLRIDLTRLLDSVEDQLTRTQRRVIVYTLSVVRANFWLALTMASLTAPAAYHEDQTLDSDEKIANKLAKNVNTVRVTRANGCKRMGDYDTMLEHLLKLLMKKNATDRGEGQDVHTGGIGRLTAAV